MKHFIKSGSIFVLLGMFCLLFSSGIALAAETVTTKVSVSLPFDIWDTEISGAKPGFIGMTIFNDKNELLYYATTVHKRDNKDALYGTFSAPKGQNVKIHIFINKEASHNLKQMDEWIIADGKQKEFSLKALLVKNK